MLIAHLNSDQRVGVMGCIDEQHGIHRHPDATERFTPKIERLTVGSSGVDTNARTSSDGKHMDAKAPVGRRMTSGCHTGFGVGVVV